MTTKYLIVALIALLSTACGGSGSTPPPVDIVPSISSIADQDAVANSKSAPIDFTVMASDTAGLAISASSDNQAVVPDSGLELEGSGTARSLTVTPVIDRLGDAFVTLIATDQDNRSASATFLLTVVPQVESMKMFANAAFAEGEADAEPVLINAIEFTQDADDEDFETLLAQ